MKRAFWLLILFFIPALAAGQTDVPASGFVNPQAAQKANAKEEELYAAANDALNNGNYDTAISGFDQVANMKGRRASGALYWKAYALNRALRRDEALAVIARLKKEYPQSSYVDDARKLEVEIRPQDPANVDDEELKLYAVDGLMQTEPEKAFPILEKILQGNASFKIKDRALFVLAQNRSEKAQQLLLSIAKGSVQPELQSHAIKWLAVGGGRENHYLPQIYSGTANPEIKHQVLRSFVVNGDKEGLMNIIRQEKSPELRLYAIKQLGPMGAQTEIRQLYKESTDVETKDALLQSMGIAGDAQGLIDAARTETDPNVRARAIRNLGIFGGEAATEALVSIYDSQTDVESKKQVIRALFVHNAAREMVGLARKETNPELKKELVRNLSLMNSQDARDYMMEILNK